VSRRHHISERSPGIAAALSIKMMLSAAAALWCGAALMLTAAPVQAAEPASGAPVAGAPGAGPEASGSGMAGGGGATVSREAEAGELVRQADAAFGRENYKDARRLYEQALQAGAQGVHLLSRLGLLQSWDGDLGESVESYRAAIKLTPDDLDLRLELGRVLTWKNDLGEAIDLYEGLRTKSPEDPRVLLGLARALGWKRRYAAADAIYVEMEEKRIEPFKAHVGRAELYAWQGDYAQATHLYRDVQRADPGNIDARIGLARVEHWQGLERAARVQINNIVLDHPESRDAKQLQRDIEEALSPRAGADAVRFSDNDSNRVDAETGSATWMLEPQTSLRIAYSAYDAEFRCKDAALCDEVALSPTPDQIVSNRAQFLTAGLNSRLLNPLYFFARIGAAREESFDGQARTIGTLGREPLFDTAVLIDRGINAFTADVGAEFRFLPAWTLSGSAGYATYSDSNARKSAALAVEWRLPVSHPRITARLDARYRTFSDDKDNGYFDPLRFDSEILTVAVFDDYMRGRVTWRVEASGGRQSFNTGAGASIEAGNNDRVKAFYGSFGVGMGATKRAALEMFYGRSDYALNLATGFTATRTGLSFRYRF